MAADYGQLREICCDMIDIDRSRVVDAIPTPAWKARPNASCPSVEGHVDPKLDTLFIQRIKLSVIRIEFVANGMELADPMKAQHFNCSLQFIYSQLPFPRIDTCEPDEDIGMLSDHVSNQIVRCCRCAHGGFRVETGYAGDDAKLPIFFRHLVNTSIGYC